MKFEIEKIKTTESFSENGIVFLEVFTEHIKILSDGRTSEKINAFYSELARTAYGYAKKTLAAKSKSEYECDEDKRKRFSFRPYSYRFLCDVSEDNDKYISIMCKVFFTQKGKILYENRFGHIWSKQNGAIIPLRVFAGKEYKSIRKRLVSEEEKRNLFKIDTRSFALKNGSLVFFARHVQGARHNVIEILL